MKGRDRSLHVRVLVVLAMVVPVGFATKFYPGPGRAWVNNSLSGVFYEVFWCLTAAMVFPHARPRSIAGVVFVITAALEFLQLWHPPFLQSVRRSFIGASLLGDTFVASDFAYYVAGCIAGWLLLRSARGYRFTGNR